MKTLRECSPNEKVTVVKIHGSGPVKKIWALRRERVF